MGVDRITTEDKFRITKENVDAFMDARYPDSDLDLHEILNNLGWEVRRNRKTGITGISRERPGWVERDEWEFFNALAPYVDPGSFINFTIIYGDAYYERWEFNGNSVIYKRGELNIKWKEAQPSYY